MRPSPKPSSGNHRYSIAPIGNDNHTNARTSFPRKRESAV